MNCIPVNIEGYPVANLIDDAKCVLNKNNTLIYADLPIALFYTKPRWTGTAWEETAIPEEIEEAKRKQYEEMGIPYPDDQEPQIVEDKPSDIEVALAEYVLINEDRLAEIEEKLEELNHGK